MLIFTGVKAAKQVALVVSLITFAFALIVATQFRIGGGAAGRASAVDQAARRVLCAGLDGLGLTLVLLVVIITPVVIIASWRDFDTRM